MPEETRIRANNEAIRNIQRQIRDRSLTAPPTGNAWRFGGPAFTLNRTTSGLSGFSPAQFPDLGPLPTGSFVEYMTDAALPAEAEERKSVPIRVVLEEVKHDGTLYYYARAYRGKEVFDEWRSRDKKPTIKRVNQMIEEYSRSITHNDFSSSEKDVKHVDLSGQNVARQLRPRGRGRIDRRAVRPVDDVVSEDGLTIDIKEDDSAPVPKARVREPMPEVLHEEFDDFF